jgi:hypothetical protein
MIRTRSVINIDDLEFWGDMRKLNLLPPEGNVFSKTWNGIMFCFGTQGGN